jgi:hypothetical protein
MILIRNVSGDIVAGSGYTRWGMVCMSKYKYHFRRTASVFPIETVHQHLRMGSFKEEP